MAKKNNSKNYHFTYIVINLIDWKIYYGVHNTNKLSDNYFGSGKLLQRAISKYGKENFLIEIDKFFKTSNEAFDYERKIVNEKFIKRNDTYNIAIGGVGGFEHLRGKVCVYDENREILNISNRHPKFLSGEWKSINYGRKTSEETKKKISKAGKGKKIKPISTETRKKMSEIRKGFSTVRDVKTGKCFWAHKNDVRLKSGEVQYTIKTEMTDEIRKKISEANKNFETVIDKFGNTVKMNINDVKYKSGEYKSISKDRIHIYNCKTLKSKMVYNNEWKNIYCKSGDWKLGRCPIKIEIFNEEFGERIKIFDYEIEEYQKLGWSKGTGKGKFKKMHIHNEECNKMIYEYEWKKYKEQGWIIGR